MHYIITIKKAPNRGFFCGVEGVVIELCLPCGKRAP